jgi:hypothetical protein
LLYTTELYNIDKAYDLDSGIFTAPKAGLYHFNLVGQNVNYEPQWIGIAELWPNGTMEVKAEGGMSAFSGRGRATTLVASNLALDKGDRVIAFYLGDKDPLGEDEQDPKLLRTNQFSGYLAVSFE